MVLDAHHDYTNDSRTTLDDALRLRPKLLNHELLTLLKDDSAAQANADEIVGLDFEPFFNSQDPSPKFIVQHVVINSGHCRAFVRGVEQGVERERVEPELIQRSGKWIFVNFHYPDSKYPVDENLISILKMNRDERNKTKP